MAAMTLGSSGGSAMRASSTARRSFASVRACFAARISALLPA